MWGLGGAVQTGTGRKRLPLVRRIGSASQGKDGNGIVGGSFSETGHGRRRV